MIVLCYQYSRVVRIFNVALRCTFARSVFCLNISMAIRCRCFSSRCRYCRFCSSCCRRSNVLMRARLIPIGFLLSDVRRLSSFHRMGCTVALRVVPIVLPFGRRCRVSSPISLSPHHRSCVVWSSISRSSFSSECLFGLFGTMRCGRCARSFSSA